MKLICKNFYLFFKCTWIPTNCLPRLITVAYCSAHWLTDHRLPSSIAWQLSFRSTPSTLDGISIEGGGSKTIQLFLWMMCFFPLGGQSWLWYLWLWANLWWKFFRPIHMCKKSPWLGCFLRVKMDGRWKGQWFILAESCWNKALTKKRQNNLSLMRFDEIWYPS